MKNSKSLFFSMFVLLTLCLSSTCSAQLFNPETDKICKIEKNEVVFLTKKATLKASILKANKNFASITSVNIEGTTGKDDWYLIATGENKKGNPISFAVGLQSDNGGLSYAAHNGDTHTCAGVCCRSCKFTKYSSGKIMGCECNLEGNCGLDAGYCNHTVTSGLGLEPVNQ